MNVDQAYVNGALGAKGAEDEGGEEGVDSQCLVRVLGSKDLHLSQEGSNLELEISTCSHASTAHIPSFSRMWLDPVPKLSSPQRKGWYCSQSLPRPCHAVHSRSSSPCIITSLLLLDAPLTHSLTLSLTHSLTSPHLTSPHLTSSHPLLT